MVKKYVGLHTYIATGASQNHSKLDSNMIVDIILSMEKVSPSIQIPLLIADISN